MRFRLRTLLIILAILPPILATIWPTVKETIWPPKLAPRMPDPGFAPLMPTAKGVIIQGNMTKIDPPDSSAPSNRPQTLEYYPEDDPT
jgi:hypothetical protein